MSRCEFLSELSRNIPADNTKAARMVQDSIMGHRLGQMESELTTVLGIVEENEHEKGYRSSPEGFVKKPDIPVVVTSRVFGF